jgi:hypothetical protein
MLWVVLGPVLGATVRGGVSLRLLGDACCDSPMA